VLDDPRFEFLLGKERCLSEISGTWSRWASGAFFPGIEQPWRDAEHLLPCTAEVKNE
jgi:hypothetical protein